MCNRTSPNRDRLQNLDGLTFVRLGGVDDAVLVAVEEGGVSSPLYTSAMEEEEEDCPVVAPPSLLLPAGAST